ncbi:MAG: T-complex protein 1 subunit gamma [Amphiamblys sp. WSBS2006]|nr:MAG: T-complex protein 1 subunit gamma [Amphiamblys sp. WSBS2006]
MQNNVIVINKNAERHTGRKALTTNIAAASEVAAVVRTALGPKAMLKMLLDPMGGIVMTNDGNAILREIDVSHPAAKCVIELSRTQDEEVGDGTTSVVILCGEILGGCLKLVEKKIHPTKIVKAFRKCLGEATKFVERQARAIDSSDEMEMLRQIGVSVGTKFATSFGDMVSRLALRAAMCVAEDGLDLKRFVRVEKIPGGNIEDSAFLAGAMVNKDVLHPTMRRRIDRPRVVLLDCSLEYKKGESATNIEMQKDTDWAKYLEQEETQIIEACEKIAALGPDLVVCEKGISDTAIHIFVKHNITALRRVKKSDSNRISKTTGAAIISSVDELEERHVGTRCGLFKIEKIGDEYYAYLVECENPKACTLLLRGPTKDILNELHRNIDDAMCVARCLLKMPRVSPGGGATEMAVSRFIAARAKQIGGIEQHCYEAVSRALEVIPKTLAQNSGGDAVKTLGELRHKHSEAEGCDWGVDGETGGIKSMDSGGVWEPAEVKCQTMRTAIEAASMLLRVDDILAGMSQKTGERSVKEKIEENEALLEE